MLAGWRLAVGLAGVRSSGRRGHQGGGVRLEGAAQAGDLAGGLLLIGQADTAQAGQIGQAAAVIVGAAAGQEQGGKMGQKKKPGQAARCVRCCSGFASLPAWWCRAAGLPGAVVVLIGGRRWAPARPHSFPRHSSSRNRSRATQFRRRMIRQNAAGRRGQILHLTAYRPIGNGELGSMPPYYPP